MLSFLALIAVFEGLLNYLYYVGKKKRTHLKKLI